MGLGTAASLACLPLPAACRGAVLCDQSSELRQTLEQLGGTGALPSACKTSRCHPAFCSSPTEARACGEMAREGIDGCHAEVGVPKLALDHIERYLQGIDIAEIVEIARARRDPVIPAAAALVPHA